MSKTNQPAPMTLHHWITWPALVVAVISLIHVGTATINQYFSVLVLGIVSLAGGIAGVVLSRKARHNTTFLFSLLVILVGGLVIFLGLGAYSDWHEVRDNLRNLTTQ